jgi:hypothetical protein
VPAPPLRPVVLQAVGWAWLAAGGGCQPVATEASAAAGAAAHGRSRAGRRPVRVDSRRRTMRILEFNPAIFR